MFETRAKRLYGGAARTRGVEAVTDVVRFFVFLSIATLWFGLR